MNELCLTIDKYTETYDREECSYIRYIILERIEGSSFKVLEYFLGRYPDPFQDDTWNLILEQYPTLNAIHHENQIIYANEITIRELAECVFG